MRLKVSWDPAHGFVRLPTGALVCRHLSVDVTEEALPCAATMRLRVDPKGPVITELTIKPHDDARGIDANGLAKFPLERISKLAVASAVLTSSRTTDGGIGARPSDIATQAEVWKRMQPELEPQAVRRRTQSLTSALAARYTELISAGIKQPKPHLAREFQLSRSYIGRRLGDARRQGLLPPVPGPGRAGIAP